MNRQKAKIQNKALLSRPKNQDNPEQERCDLTLDDLSFLGSDSWYEHKHIAGVAKTLCKNHGIGFKQQFEVVGSTEQLEKFLKQTEAARVQENPLFIVYCINNLHWVTFCITNNLKGVVVLYKDSLGGDIPDEIRKTLKKCFDGVSFAVHRVKEQQDGSSCGPGALRNMEIIMEMLKGIKESSALETVTPKKSLGNKKEPAVRSVADDDLGLVADYQKKSFCSSKDIKSVKKKFVDIVGRDIVDTCIALANEVAQSTDFKQEVKNLVESCVNCVDVLNDIEKYVEYLQGETDRSQEDPNFEADMNSIKEYKDKIMENPDVKKWAEEAEKTIARSDVANDDNGDESDGFKSELERKYPDLLSKFTKIFMLLGKDLRGENAVRDNGLKQVSAILEIDYEKIKEFYKTLKIEPPKPVISHEEVIAPIDIGDLAGGLEMIKLKQASKIEVNVKPTEQILAELALGTVNAKEGEKPSDKKVQESYKNNAEILEFKKQYDEVKKHYKIWKDQDVTEIKAWARSHRGNLSKEDMHEAIAVMDRANLLVTGHFLRDTQILAVLDSLNCNESEGKLCQISTGEGKTVIVSLVATVKVLQGKQVDVITSNGVLAEEGVNSRGNFFGVFGISVAHNNPDESYRRGPRKCYTADVVYGSMGSFQFDYLKDSFEGLETRGRRKFDFVILDEVDSLLLDNGGHIAKLAEPFPGFDSLKYVYIKIWQELAKAEEEMVRECEEGLKRKTEELGKRKGGKNSKELQEEYEHYRDELFKNQDKLVETIKKSNPAKIDLIPDHLRQFAKDMVDEWIKNAIYAKNSCHENEQYVVRKLENANEPKIVPVDNQGTGVTLKNTMWSNGLHQFVQLKHNLHLTSETLTSSLISNIGYVKLYNNNLFGLTGTLGSTAEQKLLSQVYNVGYSKVPTFKSKVFEEISGKVVGDDQFKKTIVEDVLKLTSTKRSVLIICSTIKEVLSLEKNIKKLQDGLPKISTYFDEDSCEIVQKEIGVGEIIISTNIAGRGSDFKTSSDLESNGGLHVLVCFLPVNQRVEDQAFGRTSRQGNKGTAQIVTRESELLALGFETGDNLPFTVIKEIRDLREAERLENIQKVELAEIDFHDRIFGLFSNLYRKAMKAEEEQPNMLYLLKDLKEFWAMWLHKKQKEKVAGANVDDEFAKFKDEARSILGEEKEDTFVGGNVTHNPYYSIQQAEHFILNNLYDNARRALNRALRKNPELLYAAHIKMFEVELEERQVIMGRFYAVINQVVPFKIDLKKDGDDGYKKKAKDALEKAKKALEKEIRYIETNFTGGPSEGGQANQNGNRDFVNILNSDHVNVLLRHISSRLAILQSFLAHVTSLLEDLARSIAAGTDIALSSRVPDFWRSNNLTPFQISLRAIMGGADGDEFREFFAVGLGTMFAVREFNFSFDIDPYRPGLIQIGIGLAALATGAAFPPSMPVMAKIAEVFICEGIADIVVYIITEVSRFDIKSKLITYGTQAITIGIFALLKYTQLAQKAINMCRRLITYLENSPRLRSLCEKLVPILENVIVTLENQIRTARSATMSLSGALARISKAAVKKICMVGVQHLLVVNLVDALLNPLLPAIKGYVIIVVHLRINRNLLVSVTREVILGHTKEILEEKSAIGFKKIAFAIAENVANSYDSYQDVESHVIECKEMVEEYTEEVCSNLVCRIQPIGEGDINGEAEVGRIYNELVDVISNHILGQIKKKTVKFAMKQIGRQAKKI